MECWSQKTATFMILGNVCTRPCGFCSVPKGKTEALAADEPERVAEAAERLGLKHVVITSSRATIWPTAAPSIFIDRCWRCGPDRCGGRSAHARLHRQAGGAGAGRRAAAPEVFNHNTETVPRLYRQVRGRKSDYRWTLRVARAGQAAQPGHQDQERPDARAWAKRARKLLDTLADLLDAGGDFLTLGQYLRPTPEHLPVVRYVPPEEFDELGRAAQGDGLRRVASGPLVRSSYHAREMAEF